MHPDQREFIRRDTARILLESGAVLLRPDEPFTYSSGIKSPIYCDNRKLLGNVGFRMHGVTYFLTILKDHEGSYDVIGGVATAGIPWASVVSYLDNKPHLYARDKPKEHGTGRAIEGDLKKGQRVLVIEDLVSTGGSSVGAIEQIRSAGGVVEQCLAIMTYEMAEAATRFHEAHVSLDTLTNFSTLVSVAVERKYITPEQETVVRAWNQNSRDWAKQQGFE